MTPEDTPFFLTHIPSGDDSDEPAPHGENHEQQPTCIRLPETVVPLLRARVRGVQYHDEGLVKEHLLALPEGNLVLLPVLIEIACIPVEPGALAKTLSDVHPV